MKSHSNNHTRKIRLLQSWFSFDCICERYLRKENRRYQDNAFRFTRLSTSGKIRQYEQPPILIWPIYKWLLCFVLLGWMVLPIQPPLLIKFRGTLPPKIVLFFVHDGHCRHRARANLQVKHDLRMGDLNKLRGWNSKAQQCRMYGIHTLWS